MMGELRLPLLLLLQNTQGPASAASVRCSDGINTMISQLPRYLYRSHVKGPNLLNDRSLGLPIYILRAAQGLFVTIVPWG